MHEDQDHYDSCHLGDLCKSLELITQSSKKIICTIRDIETKKCFFLPKFSIISSLTSYSGQGAGFEIAGMAR
jgi:hypothetical protein